MQKFFIIAIIIKLIFTIQRDDKLYINVAFDLINKLIHALIYRKQYM